MCNVIYDSKIIPKERIKEKGAVINEEVFKPIGDIVGTRKYLSLPLNCYILFAGAANMDIPRKGFDKLVEAVNYLPQQINGKK